MTLILQLHGQAALIAIKSLRNPFAI